MNRNDTAYWFFSPASNSQSANYTISQTRKNVPMISCGNYDYVEIACMYRYPIKLILKSGEVVEGVALDTQRNDLKEECIKLGSEHEHDKLVVLSNISKLQVCVENPHFSEVSF